LTDHQLAQLRQAALLLPVESRDAFLHAVAQHLDGIKPTDGDVGAAIIAVLGDTNIRITTPVFCCDAKETTMATQPKYQVCETGTGRPVDDDDHVLRPGQTLRTSMMLRDGRSEVQKGELEFSSDLKTVADAAMHRPGQRFADAAARAHVEEVYQDEKRKLQ